MKLIVGLGNPGQKYRGTRHNVGYEVISALRADHSRNRLSTRFNSEIVEIQIAQEKVLLQSPMTFMNLSGQAVRAAIDFYKLPLTDLLVICDDLNLPLGKLRIKPNGSAGGQNGLSDIIERVGTNEFSRLRVGIGQGPAGRDAAEWVLSRFSSVESDEIQVAIRCAADAAVFWVTSGVDQCMNRFNPVAEIKQEKSQKNDPGARKSGSKTKKQSENVDDSDKKPDD